MLWFLRRFRELVIREKRGTQWLRMAWGEDSFFLSVLLVVCMLCLVLCVCEKRKRKRIDVVGSWEHRSCRHGFVLWSRKSLRVSKSHDWSRRAVDYCSRLLLLYQSIFFLFCVTSGSSFAFLLFWSISLFRSQLLVSDSTKDWSQLPALLKHCFNWPSPTN